MPLAWREVVGVLVLIALGALAYYAYVRDQIWVERGAQAGLSEDEALARQGNDARALAADLGISDDLRDIIREEEGQVLTVYRDISGKPTVGAGHLVVPDDKLAVGDRISARQMETFLDRDLQKAANSVRKLLGRTKVKQHEFDALVDLVYNVGPGNVSETKSPGLNAGIRNADYRLISENLYYSRAADGRRAGGLVNRSERRRRMFEKGDYGDPRER